MTGTRPAPSHRGTESAETERYYSCGCIWRGNVRTVACPAHTRRR
ncbi:hypothetical protein HNP84_002596 [Thermocatellispora tengchongensis]|uniref:Uncharacterized protein n=1 Tax=Thermocatellispora tengchongensis TaxID=1073253 RepID=A0A840PA49_9ACTN|nr:hypothetical protein [Thermocatellispora tengchongensis]